MCLGCVACTFGLLAGGGSVNYFYEGLPSPARTLDLTSFQLRIARPLICHCATALVSCKMG